MPQATESPDAAADRAPSIALLQAHSLTSLVQAEIERLILAGELAPGDKLTEVALAERLGVSRGPIREAFRGLEEAGLVRLEKNRGVFVRRLPLAEALELFDLRALLDEAVGRELAPRISAAELAELQTQVDEMARLAGASTPDSTWPASATEAGATTAADAYLALNLAFHDRLVALVGNTKLLGWYRRLVKELSLFRRENLADAQQIPRSVAEHRAIVAALARADSAAAAELLRTHALRSKARTQQLAELAAQARPSPTTE